MIVRTTLLLVLVSLISPLFAQDSTAPVQRGPASLTKQQKIHAGYLIEHGLDGLDGFTRLLFINEVPVKSVQSV